jgi:uncharacterized membrane protein YiaA
MESSLATTPDRRLRLEWLVAFVGLILLVGALWLPYGFKVSGWGDEWGVITTVMADWPFITPDRPSLLIPWWIGHILTPDSFTGVNLVLAATFLGKGLGLYWLVRQIIPRNPALAYAAAAVFVVYPSDIAYYNLGTLSIHAAMCGYLLAANLLLVYWKHPSWLALIGMWLGLGLCVGTYEVSYPLIMATPVLLVWLERRVNRRVIRVSLLWYVLPVLAAIRLLLLRLGDASIISYQSALTAADNSISAMSMAMLEAYRWHLFTSWRDTIGLSPQFLRDPLVWIAFTSAMLSGVVLWFQGRAKWDDTPLSRYGVLGLGGLAALGLGFVAYLPSELRTNFGRTTLFSAAGAALFITILIWLLCMKLPRRGRYVAVIVLGLAAIRYFRADGNPTIFTPLVLVVMLIGVLLTVKLRFAVLAAGLVAIGVGYHLNLHGTYHDAALGQEQVLKGVVQQAPHFQENTLVLIFSAPDQNKFYETFIWRRDILGTALRMIYDQQSLNAYICFPEREERRFASHCKLAPNGITVENVNPNGENQYFTYEQLVAFNYAAESGLTLLRQLPMSDTQETSPAAYQPELQLDRNAPLPPRFFSIFSVVADSAK